MGAAGPETEESGWHRTYIAFLDADDIWESDYLECQKKLIGTYPDAGIYSTAFYSLEKGKRKLRNVLINEHIHFLVHDYFKESVMNGLSICWTSSLCLKKRSDKGDTNVSSRY